MEGTNRKVAKLFLLDGSGRLLRFFLEIGVSLNVVANGDKIVYYLDMGLNDIANERADRSTVYI